MERVALLNTLERLALLSSRSHKTASLRTDRANQSVHLKIENAGIGSAQETLAAELEGEDVELTFNIKYLLEIVKAAGTSDIQMHLGGTKSTPVLLVPTGKGSRFVNCQYIIAPVA